MKICILSMQRVQNIGSLLQSYSLKCMLEELGHTVDFLDIEPNSEDNRLLNGSACVFPQEGERSGTLLSKLKKLDKYTFNRIQIKLLTKQQIKKFEEFRIRELGMTKAANNSHYDYCVIGSDEVFNCLSGAPWGFTSQLFGNVKQAENVITYAASCGSTTYEALPKAATDKIRETFANVSAFSVRDENTLDFVSVLSETKVHEHLDPVVVASFDKEIEAARLPAGLPARYCVVYSYYNRICEKRDIENIKRFCKQQNMELVTVGAPQMWIKRHLVLSPFEALKVFKNAAFVITDTFHGTIFSAKYAKYFAVMVRPSNRNKLGDLVKKLGLEGHLVESMDQLETAILEEMNFEKMTNLVKKERCKTMDYLSISLRRNDM